MLVFGRAVRCALVILPLLVSQVILLAGEHTLGHGTRISLQLTDSLSTKLNNEGDTFTARVVSPVTLGETVIVPKGSIVTGSISRVLRPGRFRGKAVMDLVFHSVRISGRPGLPIVASLLTLDAQANVEAKTEGSVRGESSTGRDAVTIAKPAAVAAGVGALVDGGKGAAIGSGIGAAVGLATVFATRGKDLELPRGSALDIVLDRPLAVPVDSEESGPRNH